MKTIKFFSAIFVLFAAFNITSCGDVEPVDPSLGNPGPNPNPEGDCAAPSGFQASNFINFTNINLSWVAGSDETEWEVQYGPAGFDLGSGTVELTEETTFTIEDLDPADSYNFYVRAVCTDAGYSSWVGPVSVNGGIGGCSIPLNVAAVRSETNSSQVTVTWTAAGSATSWEIQYGPMGFTPGTGTAVTSNNPTKILSNLPQYNGYHIYVRSVCGPGDSSLWVGPIVLPAINTLSANVNMTTFVPVEVDASVEAVEDMQYITIRANNEEGNVLKIQVDKTLSTGTYNESPDVLFTFEEDGTEYASSTVLPATVNITQKTPHFMMGTFSFTTVDEDGVTVHTVMNGSFAVNF